MLLFLCSSSTHSDAVNQQSSSSITQPARGRISPRTPHTYVPPLKCGVEFIHHLKPGICRFYQWNQLQILPVFKTVTHTHTYPLFQDDVCFSHYSLPRKETDRMSPACLSIRWIFQSMRVCLRARCFKVMGHSWCLRTTWSRCGWAILSLYRSWFPASVFLYVAILWRNSCLRSSTLTNVPPVKKKKKKKRVDIKGRHELAHIWDQIPVIQPVWGGGGVNNEHPLHAVIARRHTWVRHMDMSAICLPPCLSFFSLIETDLSLKHR